MMTTRSLRVSLVPLLLAALACRAPAPETVPAAATAIAPATLDYTIRPRPRPDRTDLEITLRFRGDADGATVLELPRDRYGTPDMHLSVASVEARGASVEAGETAAQRVIRHPPSAPVEVTYVISWDPARSEGLAYSPSVSGEHFHFMGPQWIARPEGFEGAIELRVTFSDLPAGWSALSSFGLGAGPHRMSDVELGRLSSFIAGGTYRVHDFACAGKPVRVGVVGKFVLDDALIFRNTERIVCAQREWMNDSEQPFFTISLTPREGIRAGTAVANAFLALIDPETTQRRLDTLLAHEMFHFWLPALSRVVAADFEDEVWASKWGYQWVDEGFTEYIARRILEETGLLTRAAMVELANGDIEDYWQNPERRIPYTELRRAAEERRFMSTHQRIGYYRGSLIALDWDTRIREASGGRQSLSDVIRELVAAGAARGGQLPEADFHRLMARFGLDSAAVFASVIGRGEAPPVNARAFHPDYVLSTRTLYDFAPGFDVAASRRENVIRGVVPGGNADSAGLRDGVTLVRLENAFYYDPEKPMRVTVREEGVERTVEFFPKGEAMEVPVYVPAG